MIEAGRASSIASAGLSMEVLVVRSFEVVMILLEAERSGAEVALGDVG
jgi:hypothetical protein